MGWGWCVILDKDDKKQIERMYTNGANAKVIADRLDTNYENIRKYIQRNLKHLKEKHLKEKERNNIILKTTLFESQREISNNSFRQYNNSIYRNFLTC